MHFSPLDSFNKFFIKTRVIPVSQIRKYEVYEFNPIRDFGGWGVKLGNGGWSYTVSGNKGVQLSLEDGEQLTVGSRNPELFVRELYKVIRR